MVSQITSHILDTSLGKPATGVRISLQRPGESTGEWNLIAEGVTDNDGRVKDLLKSDVLLEPGVYRLHFDTGGYYESLSTACFYPEVSIVFQTTDTEHYHVPLLLNPFGYSTYRGS